MTNKEKAFADEMVFLHFNSNERDLHTQAILAMKQAGYEVPSTKTEAERLAKELLADSSIDAYLSEQRSSFALKLAPDKLRARWQAIAGLQV